MMAVGSVLSTFVGFVVFVVLSFFIREVEDVRIGEVIGTVTLNRSHPSLVGGRFRLVVPLSLANLQGDMRQRAEAIVAYDDLGSAIGHRVAFSEGAEAAQPFYPELKPLDAYTAAIIDTLDL
jgi:microcompartment protein CcmK/EutM